MKHLGLPRTLTGPFALILFSLFVTGCGDSGTYYPVRGKITFDDEPFVRETTTVVLKPIEGNASEFEPVGKIDFEGNYEIYTGGRKGAPPGRYKVVVTAHDDSVDLKKPRPKRPVPNSLLPAKYGTAETTELEIDVVAHPSPGAYDLKLKS